MRNRIIYIICICIIFTLSNSVSLLGSDLVVPGLLIDVSLDNPTPSANNNFCYSIRYRCASIQENCNDAFISMELPPGVEIVSTTTGGNIESTEVNLLPSGNQEVIVHLESLGMPNILEAGSSGRVRVCLKWNCISSGGTQNPMAGSTFNFITNPTFFASGTSQNSNTLPDIIVPTFNDCVGSPSAPGTGLEKTANNTSGLAHPGGVTNWSLKRPAHTGPKTFYDTIPPNTYFTDYIGQNINTVELLINGVWHDMGIGQINSWVNQNSNNGTLDNLVANGVQTGAQVIQLSPPSSNLGSYYIDGATALRITTPAGANNASNRNLALYVDPDTPIGSTIENCFSSDDISLGRSCSSVLIGNPEVTAMTYWKNIGGSFGDPYPISSYPYNRVPAIEKNVNDYVYSLTYTHSNGNIGSKSGLVFTDTLPLGFDFVQGAGGNDYRIYPVPKNNINSPYAVDSQDACWNPTFERSIDPATNRVIIKWLFNDCTFYGGFNTRQQLIVMFTTRYLGQEQLGSTITNCSDVTFDDGSQIYCGQTGDEVRDNCIAKRTNTISLTDANIFASKYVQGKLDESFSKFSQFGDSDSSGVANFEMYVYNHGMEGISKVDIVDILPHIGDFALTTEEARNSEWNVELAAPIEIERIEVGGTWTEDSAHIAGNILYSNTYDPCYKDNTGQVYARENLTEPSAQPCDGMAFSDTNPIIGAKAFALVWEDVSNPLLLGEGIRVRIHVRQPHGDIDPTINTIAWNSFAATGTRLDDSELFSTEPLKVGIRNITPHSVGLGDYVWKDTNGNGIQDTGEPGISNITVSLYETNGDTVLVGGFPLTTLTDQNGKYEFLGLEASHDYIIRLDSFSDFNFGGSLSNYTLSPSNIGDQELDSDAQLGDNAGTGSILYPEILATTAVLDTTDNSYDFGFFQGATICGYAWNDLDVLGDQNALEPPLDSVIIILLNDQNIEVQRDTTNIAGNYMFENINPGLYSIQIDTNLISGLIYTLMDATGNDATDSDVNSNGQIGNMIIESGETHCNIDIGLTAAIPNAATISGAVWDELSKDGIHQTIEEQIMAVQIQLLDQNGFALNTTTTNSSGEYEFANLIPNQTYFIQVVPGINIQITPNQDAGMDDTMDSDVNPTTGISNAIVPMPDETIENIDIGLCMLFSIGNLVWEDANNNSMYDVNESVISGVKIWLKDGITGVVLDSTITDTNGKYLFDNLNAQDYTIEVEVPTQFRSSNDIASTNQPNAADNDENGIGTPTSGTISSGVISIQANGGNIGDANWTESDHGLIINGALDNTSNPKAYYTVDFGFYDFVCKSSICLPVNIVRK